MPDKVFTYGPANVDGLLSHSLSAVRKKLADNIFTRIPLFMWFKQKARMTEEGGATLVVPLMYGKNTTAKSYSGYGILDTTPQDGLTAAQYQWAQYSASISISGREERIQNKGEKAVIKLLDSKVTQAEMSLRDQLDINLWATATTGTNILALPTIVDTTTTIADVSKSANSWWQAQVNASGSFAAQGKADMNVTYNEILNQSMDNTGPDFICGTQAVYEFYENSLTAQLRYTDNKFADAGFENLKYKGATMTFDGNVPSGNLFFLRSDNLKLVTNEATNFITTPFIKPENQDARVAQILWAGQVVSDNNRKLGKMTGITA